jgi:hypothetical protein
LGAAPSPASKVAESTVVRLSARVQRPWQRKPECTFQNLPEFAASFYIEFPTGDASEQLGSDCTDFLPSFTLGAELYGAYAANAILGKSQLQAMMSGQYVIRKGFAFCFGLLGDRYVPSPRIGGQIGFAVDFPMSSSSAHHD